MKRSLIIIMLLALLWSACSNDTNTAISTDKKAITDSAAVAHIAKEERNKRIVQQSLEAFNKHDVDGFLKDASEDYIDYFDGLGPPVKSKDSAKKAYQYAFDVFDDVKGEDLKYSAEGDWVAVWGKWSGKWIKDLNGQKASGKRYLINDVDLFKISEDGNIIEHRGTQAGTTVSLQVGYKLK